MRPVAVIAIVLAAGCSSGSSSSEDCSGAKCDTPQNETLKKQCEISRASAMDERRPHFTPAGVRWSCKDVAGVTPNSDSSDDRGQEYCEYFSLLHTAGIPALVLNNNEPVACDE